MNENPLTEIPFLDFFIKSIRGVLRLVWDLCLRKNGFMN